MDQSLNATSPSKTCQLGFLLSPLGWLSEELSPHLDIEPELVSGLLELRPYRMHVLGIGLAHSRDRVSSITGLIQRPVRQVIEEAIGWWPAGLDRLLQLLPPRALSSDNYRAIPELLADVPTAKLLHHRKTIDEALIGSLVALPPILRTSAIFKLFDQIERMERFVLGLRFLSGRAGIAPEALFIELGALRQTDQVLARIAELVEGLPLPSGLPASVIGSFRRIDSVGEIRKLAKTWHNCLADLLHYVNDGTAALYRSVHDGPPAVALVMRADRLGWFLHQIKGPKNINIEPEHGSRYRKTFVAAGIPDLMDVEAIRDVVLHTRWGRRFGD